MSCRLWVKWNIRSTLGHQSEGHTRSSAKQKSSLFGRLDVSIVFMRCILINFHISFVQLDITCLGVIQKICWSQILQIYMVDVLVPSNVVLHSRCDGSKFWSVTWFIWSSQVLFSYTVAVLVTSFVELHGRCAGSKIWSITWRMCWSQVL